MHSASRYPAELVTVKFNQFPELFISGDLAAWSHGVYGLFSSLADASRTHPDPVTRYKSLMCGYNFQSAMGLMLLSPDYSWDFYCGELGCNLIAAAHAYDYERAHSYLVELFFGDQVIWGAGHSAPLALHWGDMSNACEIMDMEMAVLQGPVLHSEQKLVENFAMMSQGGGAMFAFLAHHCNLPAAQRAKVASFMNDFGLSWQTADATMDAAVETVPSFRKRGAKEREGGIFWSSEQCSWCAKCGWYLCAAEPGVSTAEVAASLPSIQDIIEMNPNTNCDTMSNGTLCNLFVNVAFVWEKLGRHADALRHATAALENDLLHSGTDIPHARVSAYMVQGRSHAALGDTVASAVAFEAAVELAHKYGLWLLEALALKDFKICVLDGLGHDEHGARRLGAVLRLLKGPAELLSPMMDGLDAAELMSLPAPEAGYTVLYETEVDGSAAMLPASGVSESASELAEGVPPERAAHVAAKGPAVTGHSQLSGLKLSALKRRAREVGVREGALEEADDADDIKADVIALILKEEQQAPA